MPLAHAHRGITIICILTSANVQAGLEDELLPGILADININSLPLEANFSLLSNALAKKKYRKVNKLHSKMHFKVATVIQLPMY